MHSDNSTPLQEPPVWRVSFPRVPTFCHGAKPHAAHTSLSDKRYGNQPTWFKLPDAMHFTITIPCERYFAQKAQWDDLLSSIKDKKACILNIHNAGNIVRIRLSGSVKEAIGALKVGVENLARGEPVDGTVAWGFQTTRSSTTFSSKMAHTNHHDSHVDSGQGKAIRDSKECE